MQSQALMRLPVVTIEAPSVLGLVSRGVEMLPRALLSLGVAERIGARRGPRVAPPPSESHRDPGTLVLNAAPIASYSTVLADEVGSCVGAGEFPVVLGGDCSILLGCLLALKRRGRYGLFFCDGHADFYHPEAEPNGEVASMDLALATGRGPGAVANLEGRGALVADDDVVAFGRRDAADADAHGSQRIEDTSIRVIDLPEIRRRGVNAAVSAAMAHLTRNELAGFWVHLDADVIDDRVMPAVDYRLPDGLSWDELVTTLLAVMASGRAAGISVAILNPTLDADGSATAGFAEALVRGLRQGV